MCEARRSCGSARRESLRGRRPQTRLRRGLRLWADTRACRTHDRRFGTRNDDDAGGSPTRSGHRSQGSRPRSEILRRQEAAHCGRRWRCPAMVHRLAPRRGLLQGSGAESHLRRPCESHGVGVSLVASLIITHYQRGVTRRPEAAGRYQRRSAVSIDMPGPIAIMTPTSPASATASRRSRSNEKSTEPDDTLP